MKRALLFSIVLAVLGVETVLQVQETIRAQKPSVTHADKTLGTSRLEIISDFRKKGEQAYPIIAAYYILKKNGPKYTSVLKDGDSEIIPFGGISDVTTVYSPGHDGEAWKDWMIYKSDAHGFRNPKGLWDLPQVSVAAIGDSFAVGASATGDNDFVGVLRRSYPDIVNVAGSGNGPLMELGSVKEYLTQVKPKVVLWFYYERNDLIGLKEEKKNSILMNYLTGDSTQDLISRQRVIDALYKKHIDGMMKEKTGYRSQWLERSWKYRLLSFAKLSMIRRRLKLVYEPGFWYYKSEARLLEKIFKEADDTIREWGGKLVVVYIPEEKRYAGQAENAKKNAVLEPLKRMDIPVIDLHVSIQAHEDPNGLYDGPQGHFNDRGHALTADIIKRKLPDFLS